MLPLLQIKDLSIDFPTAKSTTKALQHFSISVNRGEIVSVVGESGSGKSVMALALLGLLSETARITNGEINFSKDGISVKDLLCLDKKIMMGMRGLDISMIFQEPMTSLNPLITCGEQVSESIRLHKKLNQRETRTAVITLFEKVLLPNPERMYASYPHQLSGGQKQRIMIALAISCNPSVLICDEPTTALDVRVQQTILELLKNLCRSDNMGMIFITHDLGLVADLSDRVVVMLRGQKVEEGSVDEIFSTPQHPYTKGLLLCRPSLHKKGERLPVVSDFMAGSGVPMVAEIPPSTKLSDQPKEVLINVENLHVNYATVKNWRGKVTSRVVGLKGINFKVYRGETLGLVGESGSGKTTLGRALLRLITPESGSIQYEGNDLMKMSESELLRFRKNIQIVFQDPYSSLNPRMKIGSAIGEPLLVHNKLDGSKREKAVLELLQKVDLKAEYVNRYPFEFSGGQRQRIVIARALILNPGFVVFDESVSALDVSVQAQILNLINDLKNKLGFTAIFISHDLSVIQYLCDRVIVLEKGEIVESGPVEVVYEHPSTEYTKTLIDAIPGKSLLSDLKNII